MTDEAFLAFVKSKAPTFEIETLEKAVRALNDFISSRRWGKPIGLTIGSRVHAEMFDFSWHYYGEVVRLRPKSCVIEQVGTGDEQRVLYSKYAVRIAEDEFEWNQILRWGDEHAERIEEAIAEQTARYAAQRDAALKTRVKNMKNPVTVKTADGDVEIYIGAYVVARQRNDNERFYGVVVELDEAAFRIVQEDTRFDWSFDCDEVELLILNERQWDNVLAEVNRRAAAVQAEAERHGKKAGSNLASKFYVTPIPY